MTTISRQPKGVPTGGQFAPDTHAEPDVALTAAASAPPISVPPISVPSDPQWYRLVYEDRPSNAERRSYARTALEESLAGDDFNVVHDEDSANEILAEAERDDSVDRALDRIGPDSIKPHQFGAAVARELKTIRERRLAVESHYVPTAQDTFHIAAAKISASPEEYRRALEETFPHVGEEWFAQMMKNQNLQPEDWQRRELAKMAVMNERNAALKAERPEVSEAENPNFTSHPVTALESRIDGLIFHRGDPTDEANLRYLAHEEGAHYGSVFIKEFAKMRLRAWRHTPIDRSGKA
ncbi:hypothetical protein Achl_3961 (plasmid) [Pseudarthrobacter chlorophenolicus A6]|uniref:Uncharacterized protein n=1 Tax=Pseudarthrobacter chlorophenolicus (strain ATCC 700700 / DSM 12829 / CIP 107037 / JCM 12360 / KCTC 9906 / NCIMB 13794 / A6) TaxID=452863 RepID=B8HHL5_PSECP|nr:hypothetical protein [Pseudarthrobacter chlorophenolicus]ACL41912.1 hypothetical protein Achl_3961 [Pseudarthrobacter chlorophenolicus A6]SDQ18574.1 hypothetical protein SAMN04489738_0572 [Pseudarthrobacter chlorophenolicus]